MSADPLRVCIVAEHASTRFGGEAIIPYHYFRLLRDRDIDAWLIVHERTRAELETLFPADLDRIRFVSDKALQKLFYRVGKLLPRRMSEASFGLMNQLLTQLAQRSIVRKLVTERTVIHQPIPVSPKFPSLLSGLGAPLVIGPLNGGMEYPEAFRHVEGIFTRFAVGAGRLLSNLVNRLLPGKRNAAVILVANPRTAKALPSGLRGRVIELPENAVDLSQWNEDSKASSEPMFLFIGRLIDWKVLDVAIEALASVPGASLEVIGDGSMLAAWREGAAALGLANRVIFHGWLPQQECAPHLRRARALVLPSIYECGGAVVLEAMACARPVIATAWGGPADYLNASCGILIAPTSRAALVASFANAMQQLIDSPELAAQLGRSGRERLVAQFDWDRKIDRILEIYASVLPAEATAA